MSLTRGYDLFLACTTLYRITPTIHTEHNNRQQTQILPVKEDTPLGMLARAYAWLIITGFCFAVLSPLNPDWRGQQDDSFPLSWYPMFASYRPTVESPTYVVGITEAGERRKIDVRYWSSGGFNQARGELVKQIAAGKERAGKLCAKIARNVATKHSMKEVVEVQFLRGRFSRDTYFGQGDKTPISEKVLYRCPVERK